LIDGKKCWYVGKTIAKANLTWEKSNGASVKRSLSPIHANNPTRGSMEVTNNGNPVGSPDANSSGNRLGQAVNPNSTHTTTLDAEATSYAIKFLCGDVDWGVCGKQFNERWDDARLVRQKK
jgi:hypothetical protein